MVATTTSEKVQIKFAMLASVFALFLAITGGTYAVAQGPLPSLPDVSAAPVGAVTAFAGSTEPPGWFIADGRAVNRTAYPELFAVISTTYGAGDGSTTFNIPDLRGRVPVGLGTNADVDALAEAEGLALASRSPKHTHGDGTLDAASHSHGDGTFAAASHTHALSDAGAAKFILNSVGGSDWVFGRKDTTAGTFTASDLNQQFSLGAGSSNNSTTRTGVGLYGNTDSASADVTGSTGSAGADVTGSTGSNGPAYLVINYIIHAKPAP